MAESHIDLPIEEFERVTREVRRIWAKAPLVPCKRICQEACGPVMMSFAEGVVIAGHDLPIPGWDEDTLVCCCLTEDGDCGIYQFRPMVCRLFGGAKGLTCEHCRPAVLMTKGRATKLLKELDDVLEEPPEDGPLE